MTHTILILLIDDHKSFVDTTKQLLEKESHKVITFYSGESALSEVDNINPDLILLDVNMPKMNGWEVCKELRSNPATSNIPIIMLTAKKTTEDEINGFNCGADDYITKPFNIHLLLKRIHAVTTRYKIGHNKIKNIDGILLNPETRKVFIDGELASFNPKEFYTLNHIMASPGILHSRNSLLDKVWGLGHTGNSRLVDLAITRIRKKLGMHAHKIVTITGKGYIFKVK